MIDSSCGTHDDLLVSCDTIASLLVGFNFEVSMPSHATYLDWTPIFEKCVHSSKIKKNIMNKYVFKEFGTMCS